MKNQKNVLQITLKKQKVRKTRIGRFFQRVGFKFYLIWGKFKAWFFESLVKLMYWIFPKSVTDKWDKEWEEEMKDATIKIVSEINDNKDLREAIQEGIDSGISDKNFSTEEKQILKNFAEKITQNSKDLDPEIAKLIDENFWNMLNDENNDKT